MAPPAFASAALTWWSAMYSDHQAVSVIVRFLHLAGILVGGGTALVADRHLLAAISRDVVARNAALALAGASLVSFSIAERRYSMRYMTPAPYPFR